MNEDSLKNFIGRINVADKMLNDLYHSFATEKNLSDSASQIMYTLRFSVEPLTQSQLCSMVYLSKQTINSSLKKLEKEGYVVLRSAEDSRKNKLVLLTEKGVRLAEETADEIIKNEVNALRSMSDEKVEEFISLYELYAKRLKSEFGK